MANIKQRPIVIEKDNNMDWEDIKTAPVDGTEFLTWSSGSYSVRYWGEGDDGVQPGDGVPRDVERQVLANQVLGVLIQGNDQQTDAEQTKTVPIDSTFQ